MTAERPSLYITIVCLGTHTIPIVDTHESLQDAQAAAVAAVLKAAASLDPALLQDELSADTHAIADKATRDLLARIATLRPDLMPSTPKTKRGKK